MHLEQSGEYRLHFMALYPGLFTILSLWLKGSGWYDVREGILTYESSGDFQRIIKIGDCFSTVLRCSPRVQIGIV